MKPLALPLLPILLILANCGGQSKSLPEQYLGAVSEGDITTAKSLDCSLTDDLRIVELTHADTLEVVVTTFQQFGEVELSNTEVDVVSTVGGDATYTISVANASDIEAFIQHNHKESGYADEYAPNSYKSKGSCVAATTKK